MLKIAVIALPAFALAACNGSTPEPPPPQLWSHHKALEVSAEVCAQTARTALTALGFKDLASKDNFTYGNHGSNRAAIKCVAIETGSFVYFAVAGPDKGVVENFRNEISRKL